MTAMISDSSPGARGTVTPRPRFADGEVMHGVRRSTRWSLARRGALSTEHSGAAAGRNLGFVGYLAGERDRQLGYFGVNAHRMRYQHFRSLGMFVGSGVVEAGAKQ